MQRKAPLPGKIFARCILRRRFAGHFGCMARRSCQSQPVFGCMVCESCHELAIFPSEATFGMHGAQNLPRIGARERTAAESCHGKTPENASRENIATASQAKSALGSNHATIGRWGGRTARAFCHRRAPGNSPWRNLAIGRHPRMRSFGIPPLPVVRSRNVLHVGEWVQSLGCAVGFGAQHFLCEGVGIPPSRGLTAGSDFESALFRWATMSPLRVLQSCAVLCAEAKSALTFI